MSAFSRNLVRITPERCPLWPGTGVRFPPDYAGDGGAAVVTDHGFDRCPTHQCRALFGYLPAVGNVVWFAVTGSETGPAAQVAGVAEAGDVADLGHEYGGRDGPTPCQAWTAL